MVEDEDIVVVRRFFQALEAHPEFLEKLRNRYVPSLAAEDQMRAGWEETFGWMSMIQAHENPDATLIRSKGSHGEAEVKLLAALMRCFSGERCRHVTRLGDSRPLFAYLGPRIIFCSECAELYHAKMAAADRALASGTREDQDACDLCLSRGHQHFWKLRMQYTRFAVIGDTCRECKDAIREWMEGGV